MSSEFVILISCGLCVMICGGLFYMTRKIRRRKGAG
jgi:hypothetical protein